MGAAAIGVMVYMPAECGGDPTGRGSVLGLADMGEIKQQLATEAAADALLHGAQDASSLTRDHVGLFIASAQVQDGLPDDITFTLAPGDYTESTVTMAEGSTHYYAWVTQGGRNNFDLHARAGRENISYEKGAAKHPERAVSKRPLRGIMEGSGAIATAPISQ